MNLIPVFSPGIAAGKGEKVHRCSTAAEQRLCRGGACCARCGYIIDKEAALTHDPVRARAKSVPHVARPLFERK